MKAHSFLRIFFTLTALLASTIGCIETPNFSNTPFIKFNSITKFTVQDSFSGSKRDSVVITIDFEDGDGDLGEPPEGRDTVRYAGWGNYELKTFRWKGGQNFEEVNLAANSRLFLPKLRTSGGKGPIEGTLDYSNFFPYTNRTRMTVVKFQVRVRDQALNQSNVIETDTISVPLNP
jgi:hypothetical protein